MAPWSICNCARIASSSYCISSSVLIVLCRVLSDLAAVETFGLGNFGSSSVVAGCCIRIGWWSLRFGRSFRRTGGIMGRACLRLSASALRALRCCRFTKCLCCNRFPLGQTMRSRHHWYHQHLHIDSNYHRQSLLFPGSAAANCSGIVQYVQHYWSQLNHQHLGRRITLHIQELHYLDAQLLDCNLIVSGLRQTTFGYD